MTSPCYLRTQDRAVAGSEEFVRGTEGAADASGCGECRGVWRDLAVRAVLLLLAFATGCGRSFSPNSPAAVATTTSYLEAVTRDLLGDTVPVLRLAEPGTCPGHFDLRPGQAAALRRCRVLLRFDFQQAMEDRVGGTGTNGPAAAAISVSGGLGVPANYLSACRQAARHFVATGMLGADQAEARLQAISARLEVLARDLTRRVTAAGLAGAPVLASGHQREFCAWLGLEVVASFRPADTAGVREVEAAIAAGRLARVRWVVANPPEGRRTADALADRLGARVVVFENFPALRRGEVSFDEMLRANVDALLAVARP